MFTEDSDQILNTSVSGGAIILENFNKILEEHPNINFSESISKKFDTNKIEFILYPNFKFDPKYFSDILNRDGLTVSIDFNTKIKWCIGNRTINSIEYINQFLRHLLHVQNLTNLNLLHCNLTEIPEEIYEFTNLKTLKLRFNDLGNFKLNFNCLPYLRELCIDGNKGITEINDSICNLMSLEVLSANYCSISEITESINNLKNLKKLHLIGNPIKHFPKNLSNLQELSTLNINECEFEELTINMCETPKLDSIYLSSILHLKCLKILIPEKPEKLKDFIISDCPLTKVEIYLGLKNTKFNFFDCYDEKLQKFDYVIKIDTKELINSRRKFFDSQTKIFEYFLDNSRGSSCKTISVREFDPENKINQIDRDELIAKWNKIYRKNCIYPGNMSETKYNNSIKFLNSLYEIQNSDFITAEFKEKMIFIIAEVFDQLEENSSESDVRKVLEIFEKSYSERFIYLNYLLNWKNSKSSEKRNFLDFIKEAIEILKDYIFNLCLNQEENKLEYWECLRVHIEANFFGSEITYGGERSAEEILKELLKITVKAIDNFDSKFRSSYLSQTIYDVINRIDNPKLFDNEMINFLMENFVPTPEYFEYKTHANVAVIKKVSANGIRFLIDSMLNE